MSEKPNIPKNIAAERAVLAGICKYGQNVWSDIVDITDAKCFTDTDNQIIFSCIKKAIEGSDNLDIPSIMSAGNALGLTQNLDTKEQREFIRSLFNYPIEKDNVRKESVKLKKLEIARKGQTLTRDIYYELAKITGTESVSDILGILEKPLLTFGSDMDNDDNDKTELLMDGMEDFVKYLEENEGCLTGIPSPFAKYNEYIGGGRRRGGVYLVGARPKCLSVKHNVLTPDGWKNILDIRVGDKICHPDGGFSTVVNTFRPEVKNCYKMTFSDRDSVISSDDHLWLVSSKYGKKNTIKSTIELSKDLIYKSNGKFKQNKWYIETPNIEFNKKTLPIHPYVLGCLIGDGSLFDTCKIHSMDEELIERVEKIYPGKVKLDYYKGFGKCKTYRVNSLLSKIKELGLHKHNCYNKYIPDIYKFTCKEDRIELLRGLMDTDGTCKYNSKNSSRCQYTTVSEKLALDVKDLVQSLGGLCNNHIEETTCLGKTFYSYKLEIRFNGLNPFHLTRKKERVLPRTFNVVRNISNIEYIGNEVCVCITTDREDGLFITDNYVVTHNCGKSTMALNDGLHIASKLNLPVLYLDTEMTKDGQRPRLLSNLANLKIKDIEGGKFKDNSFMKTRLNETIQTHKNIPLYYRKISGKEFEEILSILRRWITQDVGIDENGRTKDCLIIYDYFKLMSSSSLEDMQEFQALGFQISALSDFCGKYDVPCQAYVQLNRDGISKETSDIISQSDRLLWLCSSFAILKRKTSEEILIDGVENGNTKLIPTAEQRFGPGMEEGDYINMHVDREKCIMIEGKTKSELKVSNSSGFNVVEDDGPTDEYDDSEFDKVNYGDDQYRKDSGLWQGK